MKADIQIKCLNKYKDSLYILSDEDNELFEYDIINRKMTYLGVIKKNNSYFCTSCIVDEKIYYFSYFGTEICIYDIDSNTVEYLNIELKADGRNFGCCSSCFCFNKSIYILGGGNCLPLVEFNTLTRKAFDKSKWLTHCDKYDVGIIKNVAYTNPCITGDTLWMPTNIDDTVLEYNLIEDKYWLHKVTDGGIKFFSINKFGNYLLLSGNTNALIRWNPENKEIITSNVNFDKFEVEYRKIDSISDGLFYTCYSYDNSILCIPLRADKVYRINISTAKIEAMLSLKDYEYCFWAYDLDDFGIVFQIGNTSEPYRHTYIYNGDIRELSFSIREIDYKSIISNQLTSGDCLIHEKYPGLINWFIEAVIER